MRRYGGGDMGGGMGGGRRAGRGRCVPRRKVRALRAASSRAKVQAKGATRKSADATHAQSAPRASGERDAPWLLRATAVRAGRTGAPDEGCNQTQSDAIRRNQTSSEGAWAHLMRDAMRMQSDASWGSSGGLRGGSGGGSGGHGELRGTHLVPWGHSIGYVQRRAPSASS